MDLRDLQRFLARHIRQDGRQAAGQHALAGARRADEQHIVRACGRDLQRALDMLLSHDIAEVRQALLRFLGLPGRLRLDGKFAAQMGGQLPHLLHGDDGQAARQRGLARIFRRDIQRTDAGLPGGDGHGQHAVDGAQLAFEAQLAEEGRRLTRQTDKLLRRKNAEQDRQVIERAGLFRPGRGKVQRDAADRKAEAAVFDGGAHTLARLAHGGIRQADELKARQAAGDAALDHDGIAADAGQAHGIHA